MPRLALYLFGAPRVELDGVPVTIRRRKALALLAYLALTGQSHSREALATLFWPNSDQVHAPMNLRNCMADLRRGLGATWLEGDRTHVALRSTQDLWLDVDRFHSLLAACRCHGHPPHDVCPKCLPPLNEAASLYLDDFLRGFTLPDSPDFDEWQRFQTESLRFELADLLGRLGQGYAAQGDDQAAILYARRRLDLDPLHEPAHRQLMHLYAQTGQKDPALRQYQHCLQLLEAELGLPPAGETTALYERIRSGDLGKGQTETSRRPFHPSPPRHNLPAPTTPFVGRESESAEIARLLDDPALRLVTILGPGGIGKSRLALQVGGSYLQRFEHGVCYVRLTPLETPAAMVATIAEALDFSFYEGGQPRRQLLDYLREKSLLLLLDNFEHLLEGVGLVQEILQAAPAVKVLVTSRERLKLRGETLFSLGGLDFPDPRPEAALQSPATDRERGGEAVEAYSAVQLFLQTARQVRPDFDPEGDDWPAICNLCQVVQGMPLGLILAAAWVEMLSPEEIVAEIKQSLDFLATDLHDVPARQRSMRAVFDHSWRLLSEPERTVCQQLSIFRGGFSREAAEAVSGASLRLLRTLVDKSLLQRTSTGRFEVHELLRQFAAGKLAQDVFQETSARDRHSAYYCAALQRREADLRGARQQAALDEIEADIENVRLAWHWAVEHGQLETIGQALESLYQFYYLRSRFEEGHDAFAKAVVSLRKKGQKSPEPAGVGCSSILARLLARQGAFALGLCHYEPARELLQESLVMSQQLEVEADIAFSLYFLGELAKRQHLFAEARDRYQESLTISRAKGDRASMAYVLDGLGKALVEQAQFEAAKPYFQECLALFRDVGHQAGVANALESLGFLATSVGNCLEAEQYYQESLAIFKALDDPLGLAKALSGLAIIAWNLGGARLSEAKHLMAQSLTLCRETGERFEIVARLFFLGLILNELEAYHEVRPYCQEAISLAKEIGFTSGIMWAFVAWGEAAAGLGAFQRARQHLQQALEIGLDTRVMVNVLGPLLHWAIVWVKEANSATADEPLRLRKKERAVEILALVLDHAEIYQVYKNKAARLLADLESELPSEVVAAAQERGRARDVWATAEDLLAELGHE
jgi:predicted ATPase/DNA-binding SARP family transcriptional activator